MDARIEPSAEEQPTAAPPELVVLCAEQHTTEEQEAITNFLTNKLAPQIHDDPSWQQQWDADQRMDTTNKNFNYSQAHRPTNLSEEQQQWQMAMQNRHNPFVMLVTEPIFKNIARHSLPGSDHVDQTTLFRVSIHIDWEDTATTIQVAIFSTNRAGEEEEEEEEKAKANTTLLAILHYHITPTQPLTPRALYLAGQCYKLRCTIYNNPTLTPTQRAMRSAWHSKPSTELTQDEVNSLTNVLDGSDSTVALKTLIQALKLTGSKNYFKQLVNMTPLEAEELHAALLECWKFLLLSTNKSDQRALYLLLGRICLCTIKQASGSDIDTFRDCLDLYDLAYPHNMLEKLCEDITTAATNPAARDQLTLLLTQALVDNPGALPTATSNEGSPDNENKETEQQSHMEATLAECLNALWPATAKASCRSTTAVTPSLQDTLSRLTNTAEDSPALRLAHILNHLLDADDRIRSSGLPLCLTETLRLPLSTSLSLRSNTDNADAGDDHANHETTRRTATLRTLNTQLRLEATEEKTPTDQEAMPLPESEERKDDMILAIAPPQTHLNPEAIFFILLAADDWPKYTDLIQQLLLTDRHHQINLNALPEESMQRLLLLATFAATPIATALSRRDDFFQQPTADGEEKGEEKEEEQYEGSRPLQAALRTVAKHPGDMIRLINHLNEANNLSGPACADAIMSQLIKMLGNHFNNPPIQRAIKALEIKSRELNTPPAALPTSEARIICHVDAQDAVMNTLNAIPSNAIPSTTQLILLITVLTPSPDATYLALRQLFINVLALQTIALMGEIDSTCYDSALVLLNSEDCTRAEAVTQLMCGHNDETLLRHNINTLISILRFEATMTTDLPTTTLQALSLHGDTHKLAFVTTVYPDLKDSWTRTLLQDPNHHAHLMLCAFYINLKAQTQNRYTRPPLLKPLTTHLNLNEDCFPYTYGITVKATANKNPLADDFQALSEWDAGTIERVFRLRNNSTRKFNLAFLYWLINAGQQAISRTQEPALTRCLASPKPSDIPPPIKPCCICVIG